MKNNWFIKALQNLNFYETYTHKLLNLFHFQVLVFTIYIFLYKEEQMLKSEK